MLVLGRKQSEILVLKHRTTGERIEIMLVRSGLSARIGVEAAQEWQIVRAEVEEKYAMDRTAFCNQSRQE